MNTNKKKKLPPKVSEMSEKQLKAFLEKKRQTERKAHELVLSLSEVEKTTDEKLLEALPFLSHDHWDSLAEERSVSSYCGNVLCSNPLEKTTVNKKYTISSKNNKVYDITARKQFCSGRCYKTFVFIKDQIPSDPLWWRDHIESFNFVLKPPDKESLIGDEVDIALYEKIKTEEENSSFQSVLGFAEASIAELEPEEKKQDENKSKKEINILPTKEKSEDMSPRKQSKPKKPLTTPFLMGDVVEKRSENKIDPIISAGQKIVNENKKIESKSKVLNSPEPFLIHVEKCMAEWVTLESLIFLFGENKIKELVTDKGECIKEYLNNLANGLFYDSSCYEQYQKLCRKLQLLELDDDIYDKSILSSKQLKPLPNYSMLQEENKIMEIKVSAFYHGELEIPIPESDTSQTKVENEGDQKTNLPLVDKTAQNALRRRIVSNALNKIFPDVCQNFGISSREIASDVMQLIKTFNLQADNITFKPAQWTIIAMVILKLISIRDKNVEHYLEEEKSEKHIQLILLSYKQDGGYLDRVITWLTDIDRLLNKNNKQLTINE